MVYYLDEDADEVGYALQLCRERKPVGILFLGGGVEMFGAEFHGNSVPCVLLTNTAATLRLLGRCPDLTAIFAMSDVMAMGTIRALRDLGKRVPEDISVVGFDGISMARYTRWRPFS